MSELPIQYTEAGFPFIEPPVFRTDAGTPYLKESGVCMIARPERVHQ